MLVTRADYSSGLRSLRSRQFRACFALLLFVSIDLMFIGCTALQKEWPQPGEHLPSRHELQAVPFYPQQSFQCGPAALATVLAWSGIRVDTHTVAREVFTPSIEGSLQPAMIAAARRHGRIAYPISGAAAMLAEVGAGHPVIVLQNLGFSWKPVWHYAVVVGYDLNQGSVTVHSGNTPLKRLSLRVFENTWARSGHWGLLVLTPTRLPATATHHDFLSAVLGLEKAAQWQMAVQGYKTALARWPDSLGAQIGLGNSYYALGDKNSAQAVFRQATRRFPTNGSAFNNLAQVLWELGKDQEALEAARQAVTLGGPLVNMYRETLRQIQAGKR